MIEKDPVGRCILTIKNVEASDEGEYMAKIDANNFTKTTAYVQEPRFEFTIPLKSQKVQEKEHACLECEINDKDVDVEWFHDDIKVVLDGVKFEEQKVSRRRKLIIKNCMMEDEGVYSCTTKDDKSMAQLIVEPLNKWAEQLTDVTAVEKDDATFACQTKDTRGAATWYRNGRVITSVPGSKYEAKGKAGAHQLLIRKLELTDADTYEIEVGGIRSAAKLIVLEAEKRPVLNWKNKKVEAVEGKPSVIKVPYVVKGTKKGNPTAVLMRNGQPVNLEDEGIEIIVTNDEIQIHFKDPKKAMSGGWDLQVSNTAGTANAPFELAVKGMLIFLN